MRHIRLLSEIADLYGQAKHSMGRYLYLYLWTNLI